MEVSGKIIQVLPLQSGISKTSGNPWQLQAYVLETQEQYPRKVHFEIFGEDRIKNNACEMDELVTVSFDIESREFNGKWYTSIRAWKVQKGIVGEATAPTATPAAAQEVHNTVAAAPNVTPFDAMPSNDDSGDLPF